MKISSSLAVVALTLATMLVHDPADARLGGGRSLGAQRPSVAPRYGSSDTSRRGSCLPVADNRWSPRSAAALVSRPIRSRATDTRPSREPPASSWKRTLSQRPASGGPAFAAVLLVHLRKAVNNIRTRQDPALRGLNPGVDSARPSLFQPERAHRRN